MSQAVEHTENVEAKPVELSASAAKRIATILAKETEMRALRISVEGGGCSGFSYKFELTGDDSSDDDLVLNRDGAAVYIDSLSLIYMDNSVIDFVDDLMGQSFQIKNPNAVASCGCGTSFAV